MATSVFQITGASTATLQTYASTIEVYSTQAQTSATNAAASATSAANSAASTGTNATTAATKATEAATSATNALASENAANTSAVNAAASATTASGHASTASTQASNASSSATTASSQATAAAASATTASSEASAAATSETNAATSATNAATSETNASTSETNAASSATNASTSASNASTSATNAASSASAASTSETNAATSESNASTSATNAASSASTASTQATNAANSATAAATSATNASNSATSAATSASTAQTLSNSFNNIYLGALSSAPTQDPDGSALDEGDLYYDTTQGELKVYKSSGWAAAGSTVNGTSARFHYDITTTTNTLSGADANGNTLAYDAGYVDVFVNGVRMSTADVTTTSGNSIVFADNLVASDDVDIVAYGTFVITQLNADNLDSGTVPSARVSGAYTGITTAGQLTFADNEKAIFGAGSDLQIYHDGSHSYISDEGTGHLYLRGTNLRLANTSGSENYLVATDGGSVTLQHAGNTKLSTTSTGIDVTGTALNLDGGGSNPLLTLKNSATYYSTVSHDTFNVQNNGLKLSTQGTERMRIDSSGDFLFLGGTIRIKDSGNTAQRGAIYGDSSSLHINAGVNNLIAYSAGGERLRITSSGNVGIGTSNPSEKLDVVGDAKATRLIGRALMESSSGVLNDTFGVVGGNTLNTSTSHGGIFFSKHVDSYSLLVGTHDQSFTSLAVKGNGNVGIGTTSPAAQLEINTTNPIIRSTHSTSGDYLQLFHNGSGAYIDFSADPLIIRGASNAERMRIDTSGNLLVGTTNPDVGGTVTGINLKQSGSILASTDETDNIGNAPYYGDRRGTNNTGDILGLALGGYYKASIGVLGTNTSANDGGITFNTISGNATKTEKMRINTYGAQFTQNVGGSTTASLYHSAATNPYGIYMKFTGGVIDDNIHYFFHAEDAAATSRIIIYSDGDVYNHDGTFAQVSDRRIKDNITNANSQWDDIKAMRFVNYQRKDDIRQYGESEAKIQLGLIGQELEAVSPNLVRSVDPSASDIISSSEFGSLYVEGDDIPEGKQVGDVKEVTDKVKGVAYSILYLKAVKALQEAMTRIETLETANTALEARIEALENA